MMIFAVSGMYNKEWVQIVLLALSCTRGHRLCHSVSSWQPCRLVPYGSCRCEFTIIWFGWYLCRAVA